MASHSSASVRTEAPHSTNITNSLKRRAQYVIDNEAIDTQSRAIIRYGLETNDPLLPELVRRVDAGEIIDDDFFSSIPQISTESSIEEKLHTMSRLICRAGDEPETKSAALLILMSVLENSTHPKALMNNIKHFAFTQCSELNLCGMVETHIAVLENELLAGRKLIS